MNGKKEINDELLKMKMKITLILILYFSLELLFLACLVTLAVKHSCK